MNTTHLNIIMAVALASFGFTTSGLAADAAKKKDKDQGEVKGAVAGGIIGKAAEPAKKLPWQITAELEEACSCAAACPCWFKSLPTKMTCDGLQAVIITDGKYGKTSLKGLALAQYVQSPESKSMFESFGNWNFDNVYLDEKANEEQRAALKEIASHVFPPGAGAEKRKYTFVPITRSVEKGGKGEHKTTIGTIGVCSGHLIEGGDGKPPKVTNPPLADPSHKEFLQGETTLLTYNDAGQGWKYEKSNYMFNKFKVDDKVYAKYEAEMEKKMAAMAKKDEKKEEPKEQPGGKGEAKGGDVKKEEKQ